MDAITTQQKLLDRLTRGDCFPHDVQDPVERIDTHISAVLLAGDYAYKFKKPLNLGFLDFSTLEQRKLCCEAELAVNAALAPGIYLEVVGIGGSIDEPQIGAEDSVFEYAVRMRRFDRTRQLDHLLAIGQLPPQRMVELGQRLAAFHDAAEHPPGDSTFGSPEQILGPMLDNFVTLRERLKPQGAMATVLNTLEDWTREEARRLHPLLEKRYKKQIRGCHGDMHLGNMVLTDADRIAIFDAIEFNQAFRWIDVASEVAFLTMDLHARNAPSLAFRFLSSYLDTRDDPELTEVLSFYQVYRALVRAKVQSILASEPGLSPEKSRAAQQEVQRYLDLAVQLSASGQGALILMHGISGSGKTHLSSLLIEALGAIRLRTDVARKQLRMQSSTTARDPSSVTDSYSPEAIAQVYQHLYRATERLLRLGYRVIVDGTFLTREQRYPFLHLAKNLQVASVVIHCSVDLKTAQERIDVRQAIGEDPSEADRNVPVEQSRKQELPLPEENPLEIPSTRQLNIEHLHSLLTPILEKQKNIGQ